MRLPSSLRFWSPAAQARIQALGSGILDLLYPPRCLLCSELAEPFCAHCRTKIVPVAVSPPPPGLADVRSIGYHADELRRAVLLLKYGRKVALAAPLGELLAQELAAVSGRWMPEALVPVPIHWRRRWERGFNQTELLAQEVARRTGIPLIPALCRTGSAPPQVGLSGVRRQQNLRGAFAVNRRRPLGSKVVVLLDDVRTTGGTLSECANVLKRAGTPTVFGLTVTYDV